MYMILSRRFGLAVEVIEVIVVIEVIIYILYSTKIYFILNTLY